MKYAMTFRTLTTGFFLACAYMAFGSPAYAAGCVTPTGVEGEVVYNNTFHVMQFCDGTNWISTASGGGIGVTDGNKGDITVTGTGTIWTVNPAAISYAKIQNVSAAGKILGRATAGAGPLEEITIGTGLSLTGTTLNASGTGSNGATGYVQFSGGSGAFASDSTVGGQFFWDATNHRLGVGIAVPTQKIDVVGSVTSSSYILKTASGAAAPAIGSGIWTTNGTNVWRSGGNVGVGTASPSSRLHVQSDLTAVQALLVSDGTNYTVRTGYGAAGVGLLGGDVGTSLGMIANGAEVMRLTVGRVGIGTTTPPSPYKLTINGSLNITGSDEAWSSASWNKSIVLNQGSALVWNYTGTGVARSVGATSNGVFYIGRAPGNTTAAALTYDMTIDQSGFVGIGTSTPAYKLTVFSSNGATWAVQGTSPTGSGIGYLGNDTVGVYGFASNTSGNGVLGTASGSNGIGVYGITGTTAAAGLLGNNTGSGYYCYIGYQNSYSLLCNGPTSGVSDGRLKKDVVPLTEKEGLDAVMALRPVHYRWKDERKNHQGDPHYSEFGFIAQEVKAVLPDLVNETEQSKETEDKTVKGKILALSYDRMIAPAIKAIQDLKHENDALRAVVDKNTADIATLTQQNAALAKRLETLEAKQ